MDEARDRDPPEGRYANSFKVGHNAFEFVFDFGQGNLPGRQVRFHTRVITGPVYAKAFLELMQESIERYEAAFGTIPDDEEQGS